MTSEPTIVTHILTNISRSKDNHAMRCGQLIEYNMRNIFQRQPCNEMWSVNRI